MNTSEKEQPLWVRYSTLQQIPHGTMLIRSSEILHLWGINYLVGLEQAASSSQIEQLSPVELIKRLAQQDENARIRDASISLFLLHSELTDAILEGIETSEPAIAEQIITTALAALYLQSMLNTLIVTDRLRCFTLTFIVLPSVK